MAEGLSRGRLLRLGKEIAQERAVAEGIASRCLTDASRLALSTDIEEERGLNAIVALGLHRWYSALEAILERIERTFGTLPSGPDWHLDLLEGATFEMPETRPPILPAAELDRLREILKFRHFLRHAYAVELDRIKPTALVGDLTAVDAPVGRALEAFETYLVAAAHALED
jgi:hypothetical protein